MYVQGFSLFADAFALALLTAIVTIFTCTATFLTDSSNPSDHVGMTLTIGQIATSMAKFTSDCLHALGW